MRIGHVALPFWCPFEADVHAKMSMCKNEIMFQRLAHPGLPTV